MSNMAWLVALQFLLYTAGWLMCAQMLTRYRVTAWHWAAFMLLIGGGLILSSLRDEARSWFAYTGSGILFLAGYLALHRGIEHFLGLARRDVEHAGWLMAFTVSLLWIGPGIEHASLRVSLTYGLGAVLLVRMLWLVSKALAAEFGWNTAHMLALPAYLLALTMATRAAEQLADWGVPKEMHRSDPTNEHMLIGYLIGAALFNFSFIAALTLRTVRSLHDLSRRDALTGLLNRRALDASIEAHWLGYLERKTPFAILAIDLDHFKRINDAHGHQVGDEVLVSAAAAIREAARQTDTVARHGGEEFVVLMPSADLRSAALAAERLLQRLRDRLIPCGPGVLRITASAGVAEASVADADARALMIRADAALYRAKAAGRDRVVVSGLSDTADTLLAGPATAGRAADVRRGPTTVT